jgi:hypothetical protein
MPPIPKQVCVVCSYGDDVIAEVEAPGLWRYTCTSEVHPEPHSWLSTNKGNAPPGQDGLSHRLGIYDALLGCFTAGEPLLEYGVVEYRYAVNNPNAYKQLIGLYSHTSLTEYLDYSTSAFIGAALGKLSRDGLLVRCRCPATGYWKYNGTLDGWGLPPGPEGRSLLSWSTFAESQGLDPRVWPSMLVS